MIKPLIFALASLMLGPVACKTVESVSVSQIPGPELRRNRIESGSGRAVVFNIPFGSSFAVEAREKLEAQCPKGRIEGLQTKYTSTNYFVFYMSRVHMSGYCINDTRKG